MVDKAQDDSDLAHFWGDWSQSEKLFEIKTPLCNFQHKQTGWKNNFKESHRLKHRYLDLRHLWLQENLRLRSEVMLKMRNFLAENGFIEVETPTLFRRTPGEIQFKI